jgi:4-diphosphocytidyl-2-C-methyl-D-erythritol kinase
MLVHQRPGGLLVWAPAKLNLFLEVLGKRDDGYHEIETLMVTVDLYDRLSFEEDPSGEVSLRCDREHGVAERPGDEAPALPLGPDNLILRAAQRLRAASGTNLGATIRLQKRIPLAAGLAGGSSDAAATLVGLSRLWRLRQSRESLEQLAAELGSDVPFFLSGAAALCRGRGERVEPFAWSRTLHFVIACPAVGLATADVYRACQSAVQPRSAKPLVETLKQGDLAGRGNELLFNRLQSAAEQLCPAVERLRHVFSQLPSWGHQMSGSGSAYFGVFRTRREALRHAAWVRSQSVGRVFVARGSP